MGVRPLKGWQKTALVVIVAELVFCASLVTWVFVTEAYNHDRLPILIDGNADFTSENGVTGGDGTPENPYVIEGWMIDGTSGNGVDIRNADVHFTVRNVTVCDGQLPGHWTNGGSSSIWNGGSGIRLSNTANGTVEWCTLTNNKYGILVEESRDIALRQNTVSEGGLPNVEYGIRISHSLRVELDRNTLTENGVTIEGSLLQHFNSHSVSASNTVNGLPIAYVKDIIGQEIEYQQLGQIITVNCSDFSLVGISVMNTDIGACIAFCDNFTVIESVITGCLESNIRIQNSSDGVVSGCRISKSVADNGVYVLDSRSIRIEDCMFCDNQWANLEFEGCENISIARNWIWGDWTGIYVRDSRGLTTRMNNISTNGHGLMLVNCNDSEVAGNTMSSPPVGLSLSYWTSNLIITQNTFFACSLAIDVRENSTEVTIYRNNFVHNVADAQIACNTSIRWNASYEDGGNFWSNHSSTDLFMGEDQNLTGEDGVADTPYVLYENATDEYPLIVPSGPCLTRPVAHITVDTQHIAPQFNFSASAQTSWDFSDDSDQLRVRWDWGNDGTWDTEWSTENTTSHFFMTGDDASVLVQVMDSESNIGECLTRLPFDAESPHVAVAADSRPRTSLGSDYGGESVIIRWGVLDREGLPDMAGLTWSQGAVILLDGTDMHMGGFTFNGMTTGNQYSLGGSISVYDLPVGSHTLTVIGTDSTGNQAEAEVSFLILPAVLQTTGGIISLSLAMAAVIGFVAVVVVVFLEKNRHKAEQEVPSAQNDEEPPGPAQ